MVYHNSAEEGNGASLHGRKDKDGILLYRMRK